MTRAAARTASCSCGQGSPAWPAGRRTRATPCGGSATIAGTEFKLTARDVNKIEEEAEELTEESTAQEAAAELTAPPVDEPDDIRDRIASAITTWRNLQIITKARAHIVGGPEDLRSVIRNLELLAARFPAALSRDDVNRAEGLKEDLGNYKEQPNLLTRTTLRSFRIKTGKLARKIEQISRHR